MTASLARFLPDFEVPHINTFRAMEKDDHSSAASREPRIDVEAERAEARAEGEEFARAELEQQHQAEIDALTSQHAAELLAVKAELEALAARSIPEAVAARSDEIARLIAGDVEAVLAPLIDEAVRARIISGLADEIRDILALETASRIQVSGPEALVSALRDALGSNADKLDINETNTIDLEVEVDRTRFASRLSEWTKALSEALA